MKEFTCQKVKGKLVPFCNEDREQFNEFLENQLIRVKAFGSKKQRSLRQLGLYWACCTITASNTDNQNWNDKRKVSDQALIHAGWIDYRIVTESGDVVIKPKSVSFKNMAHMEANNILSNAMDYMAQFLNVSLFELIEMAKEEMG